MNDDFLYRIRTEPPAHFASALKARLDRAPRRRAKAVRFGLALLLFGTAVAIVSPTARHSVVSLFADASDGTEEQRLAEAADEPHNEQAKADTEFLESATPAEGGAFPPDGDGLLPDERGIRINPFAPRAGATSENSDPPTQSAPAIASLPEEPAPVPPPPSNPEPHGVSSTFIVTGPLLAEEGTGAYAFKARRSLFTVIAWTMESLEATVKSLGVAAHENRPVDLREAERYATRLERLVPLIADAFAQDTRLSEVQTRALDDIWERPVGFARKIEDMEEFAGAARRALQTGDRSRAYRNVGFLRRTCTECHQEFRKGGDKDVGATYP